MFLIKFFSALYLYLVTASCLWTEASPDDVVGSGEAPIKTLPLLKLWQRKTSSDERVVSEPGSNYSEDGPSEVKLHV